MLIIYLWAKVLVVDKDHMIGIWLAKELLMECN